MKVKDGARASTGKTIKKITGKTPEDAAVIWRCMVMSLGGNICLHDTVWLYIMHQLWAAFLCSSKGTCQ